MQITRSLSVLPLLCLAAVGCGGVPTMASPDDPAAAFSEVSPGLYRGARPDQGGIDRLARMGVKTIVNLEDDMVAVAAERGWAEALGLSFVSSPMSGLSTPDDEQVNDLLALLADETRRPVFVHCLKGMDRTGAVIAVHRVYNEGWPAATAHDEMQARGFNSILTKLHTYVAVKTGLED